VGRLLLFLWLGATAATAAPVRIVSLAPSATEILFALGAGDRVVGVSDYCAGPAAALARPRVGGYVNADFERIVALRPDLLVTVGRGPKLARFSASQGIPFRTLTMESVADVGRAIRELGEIVGLGGQAADLATAPMHALRRCAGGGRPRSRWPPSSSSTAPRAASPG